MNQHALERPAPFPDIPEHVARNPEFRARLLAEAEGEGASYGAGVYLDVLVALFDHQKRVGALEARASAMAH